MQNIFTTFDFDLLNFIQNTLGFQRYFRLGCQLMYSSSLSVQIQLLLTVPFVICVDKLYQVDADRHVTEGFSDADEGYQMKDAAGLLHFVVLLNTEFIRH